MSVDLQEEPEIEVSALSSAQPNKGWALLRSARLWPAATLTLGVSVWAQLFLMGFVAESQLGQVRFHAILAYMLPLGMLFLGVKLRMAMILLTFMPVLLLPGLVMLPEPERLLLSEGLSMIRLSASLALYLAVAAAGADIIKQPEEAEPLTPAQRSADDRASVMDYRSFVLSRIGVLIVLFIVPAYAIFQDPEVGQALATHYRDKPQVAQTFLALMHFFAWSVAAYMMVLMPALNLEYDQRRLNRTLRETAEALSRGSIAKRVGLVVGVVGLVACALIAASL